MAMLHRAVTPTDDTLVVRRTALDLLARREYAMRELAVRLSARFGSGAPVDAVVQQLHEEGLQSDQRFAESFVRGQRRRGRGPLRILHELAERGVERELAAACVDASAPEWVEVARQWKCRRHGEARPATLAERPPWPADSLLCQRPAAGGRPSAVCRPSSS